MRKLPGGISIAPIERVDITSLTHKRKPHLSILANNLAYLLYTELEYLMNAVEAGQPLTPAESNKLTRYTDALSKLARTEREIDTDDDPRRLTDAQLRAAAEKALRELTPGNDPEEPR